jgi:type I restriction enzyme, S subunit
VERLRPSILKQAFEGKLVPQDPNDEPASVLLERIKAQRDAENRRARASLAPTGRDVGATLAVAPPRRRRRGKA